MESDAKPDPRHWRSRIAKNMVALLGARGVSTLLMLALTAYLTRMLRPEAYGILGFGSAMLAYFILFIRLGFDVVGARTIARNPSDSATLPGIILSYQLLLSVVAFLVFAAIVALLPENGFFKLVLLLQALALFGHAISLDWVFQGLEKMGVLAVRHIAVALFQLVLAVLFIHRPQDAHIAAAAQAGSLIVLNAWLLLTFHRKVNPIRLRLDFQTWKRLLREALPVASSALMAGMFYNIDQVVLGFFRTSAEVGWYAASAKALLAIMIPSVIVSQAFFPALSNAIGNASEMKKKAAAFARVMFVIGVPLSVTATMLAPQLIVLFAGIDFAPAVPAFRLLMVNCGLVYITMFFGQLLLAWNRELSYVRVLGVAAAIDVALNILFVPSFGTIGAAGSTVGAQCLVLAGLGWGVYRVNKQPFAKILSRVAIATLIGCALPIWGLSLLDAHLILILAGVSVAYPLSAFALGVLPRSLPTVLAG